MAKSLRDTVDEEYILSFSKREQPVALQSFQIARYKVVPRGPGCDGDALDSNPGGFETPDAGSLPSPSVTW